MAPGDGCGEVGDCEIVSDEHCASGEEMEAVNGAREVGVLSICVGALSAPSRCGAGECCCSHLARALGSTGQLEADS